MKSPRLVWRPYYESKTTRGDRRRVHVDWLLRDTRTQVDIFLWNERGMYNMRCRKALYGQFPDKYTFLVVDGQLLYHVSDYQHIEREHEIMRQSLVHLVNGG